MMAGIPPRKPIPATRNPQSLYDPVYGHSRIRTNSSNILPNNAYPQQLQPQFPPNMQIQGYNSRRTPSTNTFSTTASSTLRNSSSDRRRSVSSWSGGQSQTSSYVALMRKQKATVWCERAQHEDPRLQAAQRAAKLRATLEVTGGGRAATMGSGSLAGKIRHGGKAGLVGYRPGDLVGGVGGVPVRLSATEVEGEDSDDDDAGSGRRTNHHRSGSGRSSQGSGRRGLTYRQSGASSITGRWSNGHTPPSERERLGSMLEDDTMETPVPGKQQQGKDYFTSGDGNDDGTISAGSGSSGERNDNIVDLNTAQADAARLASNSVTKATVTREKSLRTPEDLRRRGSVDERTMTMGGGRLFIANPDADSD